MTRKLNRDGQAVVDAAVKVFEEHPHCRPIPCGVAARALDSVVAALRSGRLNRAESGGFRFELRPNLRMKIVGHGLTMTHQVYRYWPRS